MTDEIDETLANMNRSHPRTDPTGMVDRYRAACIVVSRQRAEVAALRAKLRDREKRIRLARRLLSPLDGSEATVPLSDVDDALDLRRPLSKSRRTKGRR